MRRQLLPLLGATALLVLGATAAPADTIFMAKGVKVVEKWVVGQTDLKLTEAPGNVLDDPQNKTRFGYVDGEEAFVKLWKAWRKDEPPKVDFTKNLVLVLTHFENAEVKLNADLDDKGDLKITSASTERRANGMTYVIAVVERAGIKSINGKALKAEKTDKTLPDKIEKADIVLVGKVTQTGLSAASSFDVGAIEVREVLKGNEATKTVRIRIPSRGDSDAAKYGKKDVEGVWVLGKEAAEMSPREVLAYLPLTEVDAVKKLLTKKEKPVDPPADKKADVKKPDEKKAPAVTVWVLSYERRDGSPLADDLFLPKTVEPALAKLKEKGVKKIQFDFKQRQLFVWAEGKQAATLDDIKAAFSVLELKVVAKAAFPEE